MSGSLRIAYHITAFSWYAFVVKSLAAKDGEELPAGIFAFGGPWKYLTFLNLVRCHAFLLHLLPYITHTAAGIGTKVGRILGK